MKLAKYNPNMLILARQVRGLSQVELASSLGVSQAKISKMEHGLIDLDSSMIQKASKVLNFPIEWFSEGGELFPDAMTLYRKRQALTKKVNDKISALLKIQYKNLCKLLQSVEVEHNVPFLDLDDLGTPENVAKQLRLKWQLPYGRIDNLTSLLESFGIFVIHLDVPSRHFDGIRFVADPKVPIIAVNKNIPSDRLRFTLAHELGHLVMHKLMTETAEDEAHAFASEFLMPREQLQFPAKKVTLSLLADLKRYWRVSMQSLLLKARELGAITPKQTKSLFAYMSKLGYRKREPKELDPPFEYPTLINVIIRMHMEELKYSKADLTKLFSINPLDFEDWWGQYLPQEKPKLKLVRGGMY